jgi:hypothetical protein
MLAPFLADSRIQCIQIFCAYQHFIVVVGTEDKTVPFCMYLTTD